MKRVRRQTFDRWAIIVSCLMVIGCGGEAVKQPPSPQGPQQQSAAAGAVDPQQQEKALAAKQELFARLSGRLMEVLGQEGPAAAIAVCSEDAPRITSEVAQQHNVAIGRTSFRLRNQQNTPPSWASSLIQQRVEEPTFVNLPNGQAGALLPIRLQPPCLLCHGPQENISAEIKQALAEKYPEDQATGFKLDELRGWFWVEVPPLTEPGT